jgi:hypothetical protein
MSDKIGQSRQERDFDMTCLFGNLRKLKMSRKVLYPASQIANSTTKLLFRYQPLLKLCPFDSLFTKQFVFLTYPYRYPEFVFYQTADP